MEIGGPEWPIEGEPITSGPSDGGNGFLRTAQLSNALDLPLSIYQAVSHWEDFLANGHLHWHSDGPLFVFDDLARDRLEVS